MLSHRLPFHRVVVGSNRGYVEGQLLQEGQHDSDRASPGFFSVKRAPFDEQVPLQGVSMSRRRCSRRSDVSTTSWGRSPRTSASRPGTRHEVSRGLDAGATRCPVSESVDPSSEESARKGLSRGASALGTKSGWASMAPRAGSAPLPPWSCTVSVQEGSLGEMHTCEGPAASCVPVRPCRVFLRSGSKTTGSETSLGTQTSLPVWVQNVNKISWTIWGWTLHSLGSAARDSSSAVRLSKPNMNGAKRPQMIPTPEEEVAGELRHATGA